MSGLLVLSDEEAGLTVWYLSGPGRLEPDDLVHVSCVYSRNYPILDADISATNKCTVLMWFLLRL